MPPVLLLICTSNLEYESYPRSEWEGIILRRHPDILELRERLRPLTGLPSFSRMARTARCVSW